MHLAKKIKKDLSRLIKGKVLIDEINRLAYSTSACIFQILPACITIPENLDDVQRVVKYAYKNGIPLTPRGAGTSTAGQALGDGIIIDLQSIKKIISIDIEKGCVKVQPGVRPDQLNQVLQKYGYWFPPDPSSAKYCTIGGMVANNSAGMHSLKYGTTKDYIVSLDVILDNGEKVKIGKTPANFQLSGRYGKIFEEVKKILYQNQNVLEKYKPCCKKNASGYNVYEVIHNDFIDMPKLICGSEGTLAIVVEIESKIIKKPSAYGAMMASFANFKSVCDAVIEIAKADASAIEVMDKTITGLVRRYSEKYKDMISDETQAIVLFEFDGSDMDEVNEKMKKAKQIIESFATRSTISRDVEKLWDVRKIASPLLDRLGGNFRAPRIIEDGAVSPEKLHDFIGGLYEIFRKNRVNGTIHGHLGDANLHVNVLLDPHDEQDAEKLKSIMQDFCHLIISLKGTLTGEHGDGILRARFLPQVFGPLYPVFYEIKRIFDPQNILNPHKKICPYDFEFTRYLRWNRIPLHMLNQKDPLTRAIVEIDKCNGCGLCRTFCPMYIETGEEFLLPRARAAVFMSHIAGKLPHIHRNFNRIYKNCLSCKLCIAECPAQVDIARLCIEAKNMIEKKLTLRDKILSHPPDEYPLFKFLEASPVARFLGDIFLGISARVKFPPLQKRKIILTSGNRKKVVYIPGCFAELYDTLGEKFSTITLLEKCGFEVILPEYRCCGMPVLCNANKMDAIKNALHNTAVLYKYVIEKIPVVVSQTSCAMMLKYEYPVLLGDYERVKFVSENVYEIHEFLHSFCQPEFKSSTQSVVFHAPCHLRAIGCDRYAEELLCRVKGLKLLDYKKGCCGMAGTFGIKSENFELARKIGKNVFEQLRNFAPDLILTSCGACKIQLENVLGREVLHPLTFLARVI